MEEKVKNVLVGVTGSVATIKLQELVQKLVDKKVILLLPF